MRHRVGFASRIVVSVMLAVSPYVVYGQTTNQLSGRITDPSGAVVAGAAVTATNTDTGVSSQTTSTNDGYYLFPTLPPGPYSLTVHRDGFQTFIREGLLIETGFKRIVDIELTLGTVDETVSVRAGTPLVEAETSSVGQFIEQASIQDMPLGNRRAAQLVRLSGAAAGSGTSFAIAGGRKNNQNWTLDGTTIQRATIYNPEISINLPAESLQEFKVELNSYSAEYGRGAGGQIVMTTRSGTNEFRGAGYEFFRHEKLDTRTFFAQEKGKLRYNIFGGSIGGPIVKDQTFFFFNYEGSRRRDVATQSAVVPNPPEVKGDFSNRVDLEVIDPLTGEPFPDNIIPPERLDPVGQKVALLYPLPNFGERDIRFEPDLNYVTTQSVLNNSDFYAAKVDHVSGATDRIYVRLLYERGLNETPPLFPSDFGSRVPRRSFDLAGNFSHTFAPTVLNDVHVSWGHRSTDRMTGGWDSGRDSSLGLSGVNPNMASLFDIPGLDPPSGESERKFTREVTVHLVDRLTWVRGRHHLKMGFEYRYGAAPVTRDSTAEIALNDRVTGSGLAELLLGRVAEAKADGNFDMTDRTDNYAAFLQDDWRVATTLTLNMGLRWELETPRSEPNNQLSGFDMSAINPVCGCPGVVTFAGVDGQGKYASDFDTNNLGPRLGFAWRSPFGEVVVRGAYGIYYYGLYFGGNESAHAAAFGKGAFSFASRDDGETPAFLLREGTPPIPVDEPHTAAFGAVAVGEDPRFSPAFTQRNHVNGYSHQWTLGIQKELPGATLLEVAYLGNAGRRLGGESVNINMIPLVNGRGPLDPDRSMLPFPQFDEVIHIQPPWGRSIYHGMNVRVEKRYSQGFSFLGNYTWSKLIDDVVSDDELASGEGVEGDGYTHVELRHLDRSLSGNDIRHRLVFSGVYELPFGSGRRWTISNPVLRGIVGGWGVALVTELRSGAPIAIAEDNNTSNTNSQSQRPNLLHDPTLPGNRPRSEKINEWFDTSAFQAPGDGVFGNAPRTIPGGPGFVSIDASVHKAWNLGRYRLLFRTDIYNLPNYPNFGDVNGARGSGAFGQVTGTVGSGRQIQLSLRFEF